MQASLHLLVFSATWTYCFADVFLAVSRAFAFCSLFHPLYARYATELAMITNKMATTFLNLSMFLSRIANFKYAIVCLKYKSSLDNY